MLSSEVPAWILRRCRCPGRTRCSLNAFWRQRRRIRRNAYGGPLDLRDARDRPRPQTRGRPQGRSGHHRWRLHRPFLRLLCEEAAT